MIVGIPKETTPGERRVSVVPGALAQLVKANLTVQVETGAGEAAGFLNAGYIDRGAKIVPTREDLFRSSDVILQVRAGAADDMPLLGEGKTLIGLAEPLGNPRLAEIAATGATLFAMELMPRISRAQPMDALSSQANIGGYKAVLLAAGQLPKIFPMLMTPAGTLAAAHVFVIGAGVAGLQAIATAHRLGAVVEGYDIRPAVREQVQSVGGRFVELPLETAGAEGEGGYAKALNEEFYRRQRELMGEVVARSDAVITTAAVPGRKAPVLVTREMVERMQPGSVIVDLAAERGGNCELTRADERVVAGGVTILGPTNLPATVPNHASQMYARNITAFLLHLLGKDGTLSMDMEDQITRETLVARGGKIVNPKLTEA
jgi:NAD(P) transhydrogenase subunit alpha